MKKVLFATTALVATAGMAAAEVTVSGSARFGLTYQENRVDTAGLSAETVLEQRMRVQVQGIAETDNGLKFEARVRAEAGEDVDGSIAGGAFGAAGFAVSTGGFRLDVGNVSDVIDSGDVLNYYGYGIGFTSFLEQNANSVGIPAGGFSSGNQSQATIKLRYSVGDFTVAASFSNDTDVTTARSATVAGVANDNDEYQLGFGYSFGNYKVGLAFGSTDTQVITTAAGTGAAVATAGPVASNDFIALGFDGSVGAVDFSVLVTDSDAAADATFGFSLDYDVSAATSIRFVASTGGAANSDTAYGIGVRHSLGGGVTLAGGLGSNTAGNTVADLGVSFGF